MRILHTSDWHLGRVFHHVSMLEEQRVVLEQLLDHVRATHPDVVIIAGDLYDRAVPPADAVDLFDEVVTTLTTEIGVPVIAIAGNHDSASRVEFGARLMAASGLHLVGRSLGRGVVTLQDEHGPVDFVAVPYATPDAVRSDTGDESVRGHEAALRVQIEGVRSACGSERRVAIAHAFVVGGQISDSERALTVGGTGAVAAEVFEGFDYVALGHLHRPQQFSGGRVRYSGSLMRYSFSECGHDKSAQLIELGADGSIVHEARLPLEPRRSLRVIEGLFDELLALGESEPSEDYLQVTLLDKGPVYDAMARLRKGFPNTLHIERPAFEGGGGSLDTSSAEVNRASPLALFQNFASQVSDQPLDEEDLALLAEVMHEAGGAA